MIRMNDSFSRR